MTVKICILGEVRSKQRPRATVINGHARVYTPKDVHEILDLSMTTIYNIFRQKTFPSIRIGKRFFVTEDALKDWMSTYEYKTFYI